MQSKMYSSSFSEENSAASRESITAGELLLFNSALYHTNIIFMLLTHGEVQTHVTDSWDIHAGPITLLEYMTLDLISQSKCIDDIKSRGVSDVNNTYS